MSKKLGHDMPLENEQLDELLAGGLLSGSQYDRVEARLMAATTAKASRASRPLWARAWLPALGLASLAAAWLLIRPASPEFRAKGVAGGTLDAEIHCEGRASGRCVLGDTLVFLLGAHAQGYLTAFARAVGEDGRPVGERIWYFPTDEGLSPHVAAAAHSQVLGQGVRISPPHRTGRYEVVVALSDTPLPRDTIATTLETMPTRRLTLEVSQ